MWEGPGKRYPMWEGPGLGGLVNVIRRNCKDTDCRNGEDVAQKHVRDIPPCFAGIEVWLFDYPLPKAFFLTHKNKDF